MTRRAERPGKRSPTPLAAALQAVRDDVAPQTLLAAVQEAWPSAAGALAAHQGDPVAERGGVVTVSCRTSTWAQELDLMSPVLVEKLASELSGGPFADGLSGLRFTADAARRDFE